MSNKEKCLSLIDRFTEEQLANIVSVLESIKTLTDETADDAYCLRLYDNYQSSEDKGNPISLDEFAEKLGVKLP